MSAQSNPNANPLASLDPRALWERFKRSFWINRELGLSLDTSRVLYPDGFLAEMKPKIERALKNMNDLESGAIANPDEKRMVGHYWLRNPEIAPSADIRSEIESNLKRMQEFAAGVHRGRITAPSGARFQHILVIGIGGSALGPQFVTRALSSKEDPMDIFFFDNTDPDGMTHTLSIIPDLGHTLCIVISKSGGTKETRNGMLIARHAFEKAGLPFAKHFVAVTCAGSELDSVAEREGWLARFPMWDWVGGRTSELSAVGLLPAALQGYDIAEMLRGAREIDESTRAPEASRNPAMLLALSWYFLGDGRGAKDMVILPYSDRLELFSRYLQQLVMESLGKEHDVSGNVVNQGIAVYGNKGSTDQHAYVQQLRDGVNNFFVVFVQVLQDEAERTSRASLAGAVPHGFDARSFSVEPGVTCGDYLSGFYQGTRRALFEKGRQSITICVDRVNEYAVGQLIALFERAVGFYASLIGINAYHQPGVEAGKKAAAEVLNVQGKVLSVLGASPKPLTVEELASQCGVEHAESIFHTLRHLEANGRVLCEAGSGIFEDRYHPAK